MTDDNEQAEKRYMHLLGDAWPKEPRRPWYLRWLGRVTGRVDAPLPPIIGAPFAKMGVDYAVPGQDKTVRWRRYKPLSVPTEPVCVHVDAQPCNMDGFNRWCPGCGRFRLDDGTDPRLSGRWLSREEVRGCLERQEIIRRTWRPLHNGETIRMGDEASKYDDEEPIEWVPVPKRVQGQVYDSQLFVRMRRRV